MSDWQQWERDIHERCSWAARARLRSQWLRLRERALEGQPTERLQASLREALDADLAAVTQRATAQIALNYPEELPVAAKRTDILSALAQHRALVLTGETGSGKTTQLPKLLWEAGAGRRGAIAVTQPRRIAALAIAQRLREECQVGEPIIAHGVRFDDRRSAPTAIGVVTDGLLLAEAARDRRLSAYDTILIDEAHERSVTIDMLLGLVHGLLRQRPELRVVVSSASIAAERFAEYLSSAVGQPVPTIAVSGRQYPVDIRHHDPADDDLGYLDAAVRSIRSLPEQGENGDVLCFLPTERDILEARRRLHDCPGTTVLPLFGRLSPSEQQAVFRPVRGRKVVLSTNIAETSLTVPGIRVVIDAGYARMKRFHVGSRTERLPVEAISQANAVQRAGRAGRLAPGICLRLYHQDDFARRAAFPEPEILRANLAGVLLHCLRLGLHDPEAFPWLDAPRQAAWQSAREQLEELGALSHDGRGHLALSPRGRQMADLPCDPAVARMLLAGSEVGGSVAADVATLAAFCSVQDPRLRPPGEEAKADAAHGQFRVPQDDLAGLLQLWDAYAAERGTAAQGRFCRAHYLGFRRMREWADVRHQLLSLLRQEQRAPDPHAARNLIAVQRAVLAGMLGNVARYEPEAQAYRAAGGRQVHIFPGSACFAQVRKEKKLSPLPWILSCDIVETTRLFARNCAPIDPAWIVDLAGDRLERRRGESFYDPERGQVLIEERLLWRGLEVGRRRLNAVHYDAAAAVQVFAREALGRHLIRLSHPVLSANAQLFASVQSIPARLRDPHLYLDSDALGLAYAARLAQIIPPIADDRALARYLRHAPEDALRLRLEELIDPRLAQAAEGFPERAVVAGRERVLRWRYVPGEPDDGASVDIAESEVDALDAGSLERLVPGWWREQIEHLLGLLPKDERRKLIPLAETARTALEWMIAQGELPARGLTRFLRERYDIRAQPDAASLPDYLRLRLVVRDHQGQILLSTRDPALLASGDDPLASVRARHEGGPWHDWPMHWPPDETLRWEGRKLHPALVRCRDAQAGVAARGVLFVDAAAAARWQGDGVAALLEAHLADALERQVCAAADGRVQRALPRLCHLEMPVARRALILAQWQESLALGCTDQAAWLQLVEHIRQALPGQRAAADKVLAALVDAAQAVAGGSKHAVKSLAALGAQGERQRDVERLLGAGWTQRLAWKHLQRLPQYLRAAQVLGEISDPKRLLAARAQAQQLRLDGDFLQRLCSLRTVQALGLLPRYQEACALVEECLLAAAGGPVPPLPGTHLMTLRQRVDALEQTLRQADAEARSARLPLEQIRYELDRAPESTLRTRLLSRLDALLAAVPDRSLGADPALQAWQLQSHLAAVRRFLG